MAPADTVFAYPVADTSLAHGEEGLGPPSGVLWPGMSGGRELGSMAEMAADKSPWEMLSLSPESRWTGSGSLGGTEAISVRGGAMRRSSAMADECPAGPDLNMFSPAHLDSVAVVSGLRALEEVAADGTSFEFFTATRAGQRQEGHLSLSRGFFLSRFNTFSFTRSDRSYWFGLKLDGASYGRASSYEAYTRDGGSLGAAYHGGAGVTLGMRGRKFRSKSIRYTGDKTKSNVESLLLSGRGGGGGEPSWRGRVYYSSDEYTYTGVGPGVEDEIRCIGGALDFWPSGDGGAHRLSLGVRRESLQRSVVEFAVPPGLEQYGFPDEGSERSVDAAAAYSVALWSAESHYARAAVRLDHKDLFGWAPSGAIEVGRGLGTAGELKLECGRFTYMPRFVDIYAPRDEAARPSWFFAPELDPQGEWRVSAKWSASDEKWEVSAGGFGAWKEHVLAPTAEWLGFNKSQSIVPVAPVEDLGDGSAAGVWAAVRRFLGHSTELGASYSALRSRAGGSPVPFTPEQEARLWAKAERSFFGGDMKVGLVVRGTLYSSQATLLDFEFPSYGVADALGYVTVSDVAFFYQLKNLETRSRPSPVLDAAAGEYFFMPEPEVRFGLVWYLPG
jgi:hypothetical protein